MLGKSQIWVETYPSDQSPSHKGILALAIKSMQKQFSGLVQLRLIFFTFPNIFCRRLEVSWDIFLLEY